MPRLPRTIRRRRCAGAGPYRLSAESVDGVGGRSPPAAPAGRATAGDHPRGPHGDPRSLDTGPARGLAGPGDARDGQAAHTRPARPGTITAARSRGRCDARGADPRPWCRLPRRPQRGLSCPRITRRDRDPSAGCASTHLPASEADNTGLGHAAGCACEWVPGHPQPATPAAPGLLLEAGRHLSALRSDPERPARAGRAADPGRGVRDLHPKSYRAAAAGPPCRDASNHRGVLYGRVPRRGPAAPVPRRGRAAGDRCLADPLLHLDARTAGPSGLGPQHDLADRLRTLPTGLSRLAPAAARPYLRPGQRRHRWQPGPRRAARAGAAYRVGAVRAGGAGHRLPDAGTAAERHPTAARQGLVLDRPGDDARGAPRAAGDQAVPPALGPLAFGPGVPGRHTERQLRVCGRHRLVAGRRFLRCGLPAYRAARLRLCHRLAAALRRPAHPHQGTVPCRLVRPVPGGAGGRLPAVRALRAGCGARYRCARPHGGAVAAEARFRGGPGANPTRHLLAAGRLREPCRHPVPALRRLLAGHRAAAATAGPRRGSRRGRVSAAARARRQFRRGGRDHLAEPGLRRAGGGLSAGGALPALVATSLQLCDAGPRAAVPGGRPAHAAGRGMAPLRPGQP